MEYPNDLRCLLPRRDDDDVETTMTATTDTNAEDLLLTATTIMDNAVSISSSTVPLGTTLSDRLLLFSPRTWWGLFRVMVESPFNPLDETAVKQTILGLVLPIVIVSLLQFYFFLPDGIITTPTLKRNALVLCLWGIDSGRSCGDHNSLLVPLTLASPWTLHVVVSTMIPLLRQVITRLYGYLQNRFVTKTSALLELQDRLQTNRVVRFRRYDVYLPPPSYDEELTHPPHTSSIQEEEGKNNETMEDEYYSCPGVLLVPGALVPHTAYAQVAGRLSDAGLVVVVVSVEPTRLAHQHLGADAVSIRKIMNQVQSWFLWNQHQQLRMQQQKRISVRTSAAVAADTTSTPRTTTASSPSTAIRRKFRFISEWSLMGHSMGSFTAMRLMSHWKRPRRSFLFSSSGSQPPPPLSFSSTLPGGGGTILRRVVLWGTAAFVQIATDLSQLDDCHVLLVQGSDDFVVAYGTPAQAEFDTLLPPSTTHREVISGGTHDGFASYEPKPKTEKNSSSSTQEKDGDKTTTQTKRNLSSTPGGQLELACALTAKFLLAPNLNDPFQKTGRNKK